MGCTCNPAAVPVQIAVSWRTVPTSWRVIDWAEDCGPECEGAAGHAGWVASVAMRHDEKTIVRFYGHNLCGQLQLQKGVIMSRNVVLVIMTACCLLGYANAASVIFSYDKKGDTNGILGITGIEQESSWRCRNDLATNCTCPTTIFQGKIAKIDYKSGGALAEGFVLETAKGPEYISILIDWYNSLGTAALSWVPRLVRVGESVMVVAELCGMSGRSVMARDIFSRRMLDESLRR
jgi:hypothetical protein